MVTWWRMLRVACRLTWPYVLTPWRSPLLRWRMETYGATDEQGRLLTAHDITPRRFVHFVLHHRAELLRFLRWAAQVGG